MKLGVIFPQTEIGPDPAVVKDYAQAAEALGYEYILTYDHILGAHPDNRPEGWPKIYDHTSNFHEPFVLFSYLAALTSTIELFTGIIVLPQRQTILVAKQAAAIDVLSGGRLNLGIGLGWNTVEYESLNENFRNRGARVSEQVEVMRLLWTQEVVDYKGKYHRIDRAGITPLPVQRPIPIWVGALTEPAIKRAARIADGYMPQLNPSRPQGQEGMARWREYVKEAGRNPDDIMIAGRLGWRDQTPDTWNESIAAWRGVGATHISIGTAGMGPREHIDAIRHFKESIDLAAVKG